ncbi:LytR/AlgR family response regulator transcription factor [Desulfosporosinus lacus]|uniref:Stage 0 sporulation protein A homolog n=1 Tax=Desulfosporosinus lacus DSM 15449 TaxID=1121420 RepID=A0A1M5ZNE4_9FIRM|nr:LytTR family DNA-binding domain-containing protein [Desulfosporosinus lacus]SHI25817.1 two component transcriptional regulator, LytTR family [Desulfosporosinus lacus DSM 15449]
MRVVVADDERPARDELIYLLSKMQEIEIIGEASTNEEVLKQVSELKPDVVFLDIEMPDGSGIDTAMKISRDMEIAIKPAVVFATAYNHYAVQAFDLNATDYLLKPFKEERLEETVQRLKTRLEKQNNLQEQEDGLIANEFMDKLDRIYSILQPNNGRSKLKVEDNEKIYLIPFEEILYATIEERSVRVFTDKRNYLTNYTLNELESVLGDSFLRVHKSYIANLNKVDAVVPWFNNTFNLTMQDGSEIPVSRTHVKSLRYRLKL